MSSVLEMDGQRKEKFIHWMAGENDFMDHDEENRAMEFAYSHMVYLVDQSLVWGKGQLSFGSSTTLKAKS